MIISGQLRVEIYPDIDESTWDPAEEKPLPTLVSLRVRLFRAPDPATALVVVQRESGDGFVWLYT